MDNQGMTQAEPIAKVLIYGDIHLNSKNYGGHVNYAEESLHYFHEITEVAKELKATHIIGLGDFTFSRFHTLEYRSKVEAELEEQYKITNGERYEVKGNHDTASYGMTEYEYYTEKGLIKTSTNLHLGNTNIAMVDSGLSDSWKILPVETAKTNIVLAHDYFKFSDTRLADYGTAIELDNKEDWFGVDYLICGHIHKRELFQGKVIKGTEAHNLVVHYLGCMSRPQYREGHMDTQGCLVCLNIYENEDIRYDIIEVPLWDLNKSFNLSFREDKASSTKEKPKVDISDIVKQLNTHERNVGNPEDIISAMQGVDERYKKKAIDLLKCGQS